MDTQWNRGVYKDLFVRAAQLDKEAFSRLYRELYTPIYRYIFFRVGSRAQAEDLAQTVFLKLWRELRAQKGEDLSLSWIYTVARNGVIDFWKKKKEMPLGENLEIIAGGKTSHEIWDEQKRVEELRAALVFLSEEQREVILLKFFEGFSNAEMEKIMDKSSDAVRSLQYRALSSLRDKLKEEKPPTL